MHFDSFVYHCTNGFQNIAFGYRAGYSLSGNSSNNIEIGNIGLISDYGVTRIGTSGTQTSFFAAGIRGVQTGIANAAAVVIDSNGQLGPVSSSQRFKEDIQDMREASSGLLRLRPVTFRYGQPYADGSQPIDYGLIAEEAAEIYPGLVVNGAEGEIETVRYHKLNAMLLNGVRKQQHELSALKAQLSELRKLLERLTTASANR